MSGALPGRRPHAALFTSPRNPRVVAALALRERAARDARGCTLVDGLRELERALTGGAVPVEVFVDPERPAAVAVAARARAAGAEVIPVGAAVADRLSYGARSEGLVAVVPIPDHRLEALVLPPDPLLVVLESVEKPGNVGAVLRTADGAGADAVLVADPRTDCFNPNVVRASLGTVFAVPMASATAAALRARLDADGIRPVALRVDAERRYTEADLRGPVAIVLGSEVDGLGTTWAGPGVEAVRLPMLGVADSLNVAAAAAVVLYEALRQRSEGG